MESRDSTRPEADEQNAGNNSPELQPQALRPSFSEVLEISSETDPTIEAKLPEDQIPESQTFDELLPEGFIRDGIRKLGFSIPTAVQRKAVPAARLGNDLVVQSRTGSGKTIAYVLPLLETVQKLTESGRPKNEPMALVIVPTRELASQVQDVIISVAGEQYAPTLIIGGADAHAQDRALKADGRIVIGTPGRLLDLLRGKVLKLNNCRFFVLDEADETLSLGFLQDVRAILSRLPDRRQGIFTSATITPRVDMLANSFLDNAQHVGVDETYNDLPSVTHHYCEVGGDLMAKPNALCDLIETMRPTSAIIFCNTKSDTQLVEVLLRRRGFDARRLNSDLTQSQRNRVMQKIKQRELKFLVATDIAARGIDIEQIDTVINYAIHDQPETYLHRTGRTGRAGRSGKAISLVGPRDFSSFHYVRKIVNVEFEKIALPTDEEVAEARLAHLHEIIRLSQIELGARDTAISRKLLAELGEAGTFPDELVEMVAKLCRHTLEHHVQTEAKSLDEELAALASEAATNEERPRRDHGRNEGGRDNRRGGNRDNRDRQGDHRQGDRGRERNDRSRDARNDRGDRRDQEPRQDRSPERSHPAEHDPRNANRDRPQQGRPQLQQGSSDPRPQRDHRRDEPVQSPAPKRIQEDFTGDDVRLYVGQGTTHGMSEDLFRSLASEFGEIDPRDLKAVWFREDYGFADVAGERVNSILENLSGIEYNGFALPVEIATTVRRNHQGPQRGGYHRGGQHRGGYRNQDRRDR